MRCFAPGASVTLYRTIGSGFTIVGVAPTKVTLVTLVVIGFGITSTIASVLLTDVGLLTSIWAMKRSPFSPPSCQVRATTSPDGISTVSSANGSARAGAVKGGAVVELGGRVLSAVGVPTLDVELSTSTTTSTTSDTAATTAPTPKRTRRPR